MPRRPDALLLWGRAAVLTGSTFLVGALGHVTAGGLLPGVPALVLLLATGTTLAAVFLSRPASTRLLVGLVVVGQTLVHGALSLTAGHGAGHGAGHRGGVVHVRAAPGSLPTGSGGRVGSLQDHYEATVAAPVATGLTVPDPASLLDHAPMFLAHAAAGVLVGLWLAVGERAVWALLALAVRTVLAPLVAVLLPLTPARRLRPAVAHLHPLHRTALEPRRRAASYVAVRRPSSPPDPTPLDTASRRTPAVRRSRRRTHLEETHDHRTTPSCPQHRARPTPGTRPVRPVPRLLALALLRQLPRHPDPARARRDRADLPVPLPARAAAAPRPDEGLGAQRHRDPAALRQPARRRRARVSRRHRGLDVRAARGRSQHRLLASPPTTGRPATSSSTRTARRCSARSTPTARCRASRCCCTAS